MTAALKKFETDIKQIFPNIVHNSMREYKGIGSVSLMYDFAFDRGYNNIFHNALGHFRISITSKNYAEDYDKADGLEVEAILADYKLRQAGIKFRKINAKNIDEALKKTVAWFKKNEQALNSFVEAQQG